MSRTRRNVVLLLLAVLLALSCPGALAWGAKKAPPQAAPPPPPTFAERAKTAATLLEAQAKLHVKQSSDTYEKLVASLTSEVLAKHDAETVEKIAAGVFFIASYARSRSFARATFLSAAVVIAGMDKVGPCLRFGGLCAWLFLSALVKAPGVVIAFAVVTMLAFPASRGPAARAPAHKVAASPARDRAPAHHSAEPMHSYTPTPAQRMTPAKQQPTPTPPRPPFQTTPVQRQNIASPPAKGTPGAFKV